MEKTFADLLRDSPYDGHRWHSLRRGGAAAAFHRSPNVPYFVWWGRWQRLATALGYALGYSDPAVVGVRELPWPVGVQAADGGLVALLADLWVGAMYAKSEKPSKSAGSEVLVPVPEGPIVSLADMDVAEAHKELDGAGSGSDSTAVSSASSVSGESPTSAKNEYAAPATATAPEPVSAKFTPGSQPPAGVGGKRARRGRAPVQAPGVGTAGGADPGVPRGKRRLVDLGRYLLVRWHHAAGAGVSLGSARARRPAPSDGILMGFQVGLVAKQLRIPRVSVRARAQGPGPVREVVGSLGSSPPGGVTREIPSACDPMLRSARGSLQVLAPSDQGPRPLRRCNPRMLDLS